ncbi:hypothetical protein A1O3_10058 [Capronia epimyces CBS 606.96]|uniref:Uncharacterized protein n=1 Tax=Capronia epimyces CBS 606.96 TaxID=1182542 RepID=W9XIX9_9EURO|nr:uncharacterized protein A1O3_10058 [Capronia epimyces CBS 606.96]EXJ76901.1 hypothetical protein A1O3_10058 [Capronia epimyces CBS 606.96]
MTMNELHDAVRVLVDSNIQPVVIGELAQNYYNVPIILHEIELCVPESQLPAAEQALVRSGLYARQPRGEPNIYTEYKTTSPTFRYLPAPDIPVVLFSDRGLGHLLIVLEPSDHDEKAAYSQQIDYLAHRDVVGLPIPRLGPYVQLLDALFQKTGDGMFQMKLEQLVDAMDLDMRWYQVNLAGKPYTDTLRDLIDTKHLRVDQFSGSTMTLINLMSAADLRRIPGASN